jgi:hypothetical protein
MIKSRRMIWAGHVACMGETRNACRISMGKPGGKTKTWVDNIVTYMLKARTVEPEKQLLLANSSEITYASRQRPRNIKQNNAHY